tara:strand:+ start:19 stop:534 length:516 start_codon:yes stop_codon:yes gene_type:complete
VALTRVTGDGLAYSGMPTGSVLQVVQAVKGDDTNFESTSFTDISGVTVNITPKFSTSKVLVQVSISGEQADDTHVTHFRLMRGSTAIGVGDSAGNRTQGSFSIDSYGAGSLSIVSAHFHYLDSPATTSQTTYKLQGLSSDGIFYVGRNQDDSSGFENIRTPTVITVTEIAG